MTVFLPCQTGGTPEVNPFVEVSVAGKTFRTQVVPNQDLKTSDVRVPSVCEHMPFFLGEFWRIPHNYDSALISINATIIYSL